MFNQGWIKGGSKVGGPKEPPGAFKHTTRNQVKDQNISKMDGAARAKKS